MPQLRLKLLEPHRASLEKCVYCPKLSRAACPVSNAEANEALTPWGKMSMAYFAARGDVPIDAHHAAPAWACSACYACRERCDHHNDVAAVLNDARADLFARGAAPQAASAASDRFWAGEDARRHEINKLDARREGGRATAGDEVPVLIGCGYVRHAPDVARDALNVIESLLGTPTRAVRACCGLPLLYAGDRAGFQEAAQRLAAEVAGTKRFVAVDPGCARAALIEHPRIGVHTTAPELFVDIALASLDQIQRSTSEQRIRYHDPCQLGRGLDRYDAPRQILTKIAGRPPEELIHRRELADCSGGGGLLPATRPEASAAIADARIAEHRALGGGLLVTHCGRSLHRFRSRGEPAEDLVSLVARGATPR